ncbi:competence protein ComEC [Bacilli bacterium PM5-3]|nr:competence protein ComEC [Bacilli bacterium PM5-3]MDH6603492.1 competence protein ComEC [Bacilli bacterium PM5-9]
MNNLLIHFVISIISFALAIFYHEPALIVLGIIFMIIVARFSLKYLFLLIIMQTCFIFYFNYRLIPNKPSNRVFEVVKVNQYSYHLKNSEAKILLKTSAKLNKGDIIEIKTPLKEVQSLENFKLFSMTNYLKSNSIFYETTTNTVSLIKKSKNKQINSKINNYYNYLFFMEKNEIDSNIKESLISLALIHLVVVSGFHFNFIYKVLKIIFQWIKRDIVVELICFSVLFYYLNILSFSYPAFRAFLSLTISKTPLNDKLSKINQLALSALIIIVIFPLSTLSFSFILTFVTSLFLSLIPENLSKNKLLNSFVIFLGTIPLITSINYQISLISFILQLLISPVIPILYLSVFLGNHLVLFENIALFLIESFEKIILFLKDYNIVLETGGYSILFSLIYYSIYLLTLYFSKNNKLLITIPFVYVLLFSYLPSFSGFISFLNVGQGDCIVIKPPFSNEAMMIDVAKPYKSNTVNNIIIPYLKAHKIKKIKTLVITHNDVDHAGGKSDLIKNFKVEKIIDKKTKQINFDKYHFIDILSNTKFKDKNANSITLYTRINGLNYLFTGDINSESELEFKKYVSKLPVDILKVAHHGSKTSTSTQFLDLTNPKIAIIQSKKNNRYNHPHPEIVNRLKQRNISIYNNAYNGTITIYYNFFYNYLKKYK